MQLSPINNKTNFNNTSFQGLWGKRGVNPNKRPFCVTYEYVDYHPFKDESADTIFRVIRKYSGYYEQKSESSGLTFRHINKVVPVERLPFTEEQFKAYESSTSTNKLDRFIEKELKNRELTSYLRKTADNIVSKTKSPKLFSSIAGFFKKLIK